MRADPPSLGLQRPTLTEAQLDALDVGSVVRNLPGYSFRVIALVEGVAGEHVAVLWTVDAIEGRARYLAVTRQELSILYTPA